MNIYEKRVAINESLIESESGFMLHSAGIIINKKGFLFLGDSESGKSTVSQKFNNNALITNDDKNFVEFKGFDTLFYSAPVNKEKPHFATEGEKGFLSAVFLLNKEWEKDSYIEKCEDKTVLWPLIIRSAPFPERNELFHPYYRLIDRFLDSSSFYKFYHNLKEPVDSVIKKILEAY